MAKKKTPDTPNLGAFKSQNELLISAQRQAEELGKSENEILAIQQKILEGRIKSEAVLQRELALTGKIISKQAVRDKIQASILKTEQSLIDITKDLNDKAKKIINFKGAEVDASRDLIKEARNQITEQAKLGILTQDQSQYLLEELDKREKNLDAMVDMQKHAEKYGGIIGNAMDEAKSATDQFFASFPGGQALSKMLGFDAAFESLKAGAQAAMGAVVKSLLAGQGPMAALKAGQAAFNAVAMMNPYVAIAAALLLVVGLLHQQNKAIRDQAKAQGVSLAVAKQQVLAAKQQVATGQTILANTEDILAAQNAVNDVMGSSIAMNAENAAAVADIGESMGYGAEQAGKSAAAMMQMGVAAADVADMQMETNLMAVKAGVDMGKVQADIAANAGEVSKYFAGNPKALAAAAVEAAKMGMSLKDMAAVSDNLLDFEKSISAQFELQAMTGRQMNFDKARQLALEGDIAGASAAVLEQVGSIHDFNKMDVLERRKLAEATGMSVEQLQKSLTLEQLRGQLTDDQLAAAQGLNLTAEELKNLTADELKEKLASQDATAKMANTMNQLKETALMALQPLMDMLSVVFNILAPVMKLGMFVNNLLLIPFKAILGVIKGVFDALMTALQPLMDIFNEIGSLLGGDGGIGAMFSKIGEIIGTVVFIPIRIIATILKAVLLPIIEVIAEVFTVIGDIITFIGEVIDTYLIQPIDKAINMLSKLNPANWFGGDDEASVTVTADGEALEAVGAVDDGVIQNGKIISTNPADTLIAVKEPNSLLDGIGEMASSLLSMSPLSMAADAIGLGGLFGGEESTEKVDKTTPSLLTEMQRQNELLVQMLTAMKNPVPVQVGSRVIQEVGSAIRTDDTYRTRR